MNVAESGIAQRDNFGGSIELHRARAQRDHRVCQRYILALKSLDVAHHLRLRVVLIEDFVGEEGRGTYELTVNMDRVLPYFVIEVAFLTEGRSEDIAEDTQIFRQRRLIDTQQSDYSAGSIEEIDTTFFGDFTELVGEAWLLGKNHAERVEEVLV